MNISGYDTWKLAGPPEPEGPECWECGGYEEVRIMAGKPLCRDCFLERFYELPTPEEWAQEQADERADLRRDQ